DSEFPIVERERPSNRGPFCFSEPALSGTVRLGLGARLGSAPIRLDGQRVRESAERHLAPARQGVKVQRACYPPTSPPYAIIAAEAPETRSGWKLDPLISGSASSAAEKGGGSPAVRLCSPGVSRVRAVCGSITHSLFP